MEEFPSNNESQEVSRGRSSEEVSVMEMERSDARIKTVPVKWKN